MLLALLSVSAAGAAAQSLVSDFQSTGSIVAQATISGTPLSVGGTIALDRRGSLYRLDLLSLGFPGTDPTASAIAGALIAPGGATLIYDGASGALSAYSTSGHVYYSNRPDAPAGRGAASATGARTVPAVGIADPLAALAGITRQLRDVVHAAIIFTGHSVVNGHPAANLDLTVSRQRPGAALEEYHAQVALADDLDGFPVQILVSSKPPTPQDFGGSVRLDLTSVTRATPAADRFTIPPGYTRVTSLGDIIAAHH